MLVVNTDPIHLKWTVNFCISEAVATPLPDGISRKQCKILEKIKWTPCTEVNLTPFAATVDSVGVRGRDFAKQVSTLGV